MKKILIISLLASCLFAEEQNYIELGGGYIQSKTNFSASSLFSNPQEKISSLGNADSQGVSIPYISFFYGYELNKNSEIYMKFLKDSLDAGRTFKTKYGLFDIGIKTILFQEEWENPFLTGVDREITYASEYGSYLEYKMSISKQFKSSIKYEFSQKVYDEDEVIKVLKRDGYRHVFSYGSTYLTKVFNKKAAIISGLVYEIYDADGEASSYDKYGLKLGVASSIGKDLSLSVLTGYSKKEYKKFNPEVSTTVESEVYGVLAKLKWDKLLNNENTYLNFIAGYEREEANHDFYNKEAAFSIMSIGYRF